MEKTRLAKSCCGRSRGIAQFWRTGSHGEAWRASPAGNLGQRLCVSGADVRQGPGPDQFGRFRGLSNPDQTLHRMENRLEDLPSRRTRLDRSGQHSTDLR
jgi:hypothetical protein